MPSVTFTSKPPIPISNDEWVESIVEADADVGALRDQLSVIYEREFVKKNADRIAQRKAERLEALRDAIRRYGDTPCK